MSETPFFDVLLEVASDLGMTLRSQTLKCHQIKGNVDYRIWLEKDGDAKFTYSWSTDEDDLEWEDLFRDFAKGLLTIQLKLE